MGLTSQGRSELTESARALPFMVPKAKRNSCSMNSAPSVAITENMPSACSTQPQRVAPVSAVPHNADAKIYSDPLLLDVLWEVWRAANQPCAKRLKALLPQWLPFFDRFIIFRTTD